MHGVCVDVHVCVYVYVCQCRGQRHAFSEVRGLYKAGAGWTGIAIGTPQILKRIQCIYTWSVHG